MDTKVESLNFIPRANYQGANLRGVDLWGAKLCDTDFRNTIFSWRKRKILIKFFDLKTNKEITSNVEVRI